MDGNGFNGQGALDTSLNVAGRGLGAVAALADLWAHRDPYALLGARNQLLQDPGFRDSAGPFLSGLVQIGGSRQPMSLGPGGTGPSAPNLAYMPNFPPLGPETALKQNVAAMTNEELGRLTPDQQHQFAQAELGIHPSIAEQFAQLPSGWKPVRMGPQGVSFAPGGAATNEPIPPGFTQYGGKLYRTEPLAGPGGGEPKEPPEYHAWKGQQPPGSDTSITAFWHAKGVSGAEASGLRTDENLRARIALQDYVRTNATKTMRERAPKVLEGADAVAKDMQDVDLGPFVGRGHEFWQQVIGGKDPQYAKLRADMTFLTSQLTFMHTGARMPVQIAAKFDALLGQGEQDPANMLGAIQAIRDYAGMVGEPSPQPPPRGGPGSTPGAKPSASDQRTKNLDAILFGPGTPP